MRNAPRDVALGYGARAEYLYVVTSQGKIVETSFTGQGRSVSSEQDAERIHATTNSEIFVSRGYTVTVVSENEDGGFDERTIMSSDESRQATPLDGVGDKARTTGVAAIGGHGNDVLFDELRVPHIRHVGRGSVLVGAMDLIGSVLDCVGVMGETHSEFVSVASAIQSLERACDYIDKHDPFQKCCRGRTSGNSRVGALTDDFKRGLRMNLTTLRRIAA